MQMGHSSWAKLGLVTRLKMRLGRINVKNVSKLFCYKIENEPWVYKYVKNVLTFCHYKIKNEAGMYK